MAATSSESHAVRSESLLEKAEYADAEREAKLALEGLPLMARAALTRGRALLYAALAKMDEDGERPSKEVLNEAERAFMQESYLDNGRQDAKYKIEKLYKY